ncbi:MAG: SUMF1/EgtB/PvdO family nonheme iron enzyme [Bacteroidia bacterium]|nr:SUMF1/EgtB/PvdO family nonheme iron enzyme [Bacteroidia bacterium]
MASKIPINENDLNELLRGLYLDEHAKTVNSKEAQFVFEQEYKVKTNSEKENELISKLSKKQSGFGNYKFYLSFLIVAFTVFFMALPEKNSLQKEVSSIATNQNQKNNNRRFSAETQEIKSIIDTGIIKEEKQFAFIQEDTFGHFDVQRIILSGDSSIVKSAEPKLQANLVKKIQLVTEADKTMYKKIKLLMLKKLYANDKSLYTHVEADKMDYNGAPTIIEAFSLRNMGITNLEYKTFLADLLMQERNEEYIAAQVMYSNWSVYGYTNLAGTYFQEEKYNDFPVVNVSIVGAKIFCSWLEEESLKYMKANSLKVKPLQVRLPYDIEWLYAARTGYTTISFERGYNTIYDETEGLIDKSYAKRVEIVKKKSVKKDSLYSYIVTNHYNWNEKEITELFAKGLNYYPLAPADTINSARMKIYCKVGRVSEMVIEKKSEKTWLSGSSWKSKEDYLKLQSEFNAKQSSPFVGFRFVVINGNDAEYKNPFW